MLLVHLTLTVPNDQYYVVVEDYFPAGTEVVNTALQTTELSAQMPTDTNVSKDWFTDGWGWWYFNSPQILDQKIRWVASYLPAGTYHLVYYLQPLYAGEYQVLPGHAWSYYFPDVEGTTSGALFTVTP